MGIEPTDNQSQIDDYYELSEDESKSSERNVLSEANREWTCRVCGFTANNKSVVENCHPESRLDRERNKFIEGPEGEHEGFVLPPHMNKETRSRLCDIESAIRSTSREDALSVVADYLIQCYSSSDRPTVGILFVYLIWLQQYQVLPGYPIRNSTNAKEKITIREFCNSNTQFHGKITEAQIRELDLVYRNRIYRTKVLSVTPKFFENASFVDNGFNTVCESDAKSSPCWGDFDNPEAVLFAQGTPHNTVVREARDWLATHPLIDWARAPHIIGTPRKSKKETQSTSHTRNEPSENPVYMFDFAGFTDQSHSKLAVVGIVMNTDFDTRVLTKINHIRKPTAAAVVVFRSRKGIHDWIDSLDSTNQLMTPAAPTDDVAEHYTRLPSIQAVNKEIKGRVPELDHVQFVTAKQLIDDVITPVDVFPDSFRAGVLET
jgi:hypothetical protein